MKTKTGIVYFLGIGGIGMSALARYFHGMGVPVYGYDACQTPLTIQLEAEGMCIHYEENVSQIPKNISQVIYTPAVPETNAEFLYFKSRGYKMEKRAAVVGRISRNLFTIAVAGTHGKTSITAMIAQILQVAGMPVVAFIGGIAKNFGTNFISSPSPKYMVVEADEYDRSLLTLHPDIAVITSMDADHLAVYSDLEDLEQTFMRFAQLLPEKGVLIHEAALGGILNGKIKNSLAYGISENAVLSADNIHLEADRYCFDVLEKGKLRLSLRMNLPGKHYVENTLAAVSVALQMSVPVSVIKQALENFTGVQRRFDYHIKTDETVYIDDYAHHPKEILATLHTVRQLYPGKELTVVFQPHLYSRTRDFANEFASALSEADRLILLEIYPAREKPIPGVTSQMIADKVSIAEKYVMSKKELLAFLKKEKPSLLMTLGAGDIGLMTDEIVKTLKTL